MELVLKIYKDDHLKSYFREKAILNELANLGKKKEVIGFPQIVSKMESQVQAEILMIALGPSLKKLVK